jgi:hypothetical protein
MREGFRVRSFRAGKLCRTRRSPSPASLRGTLGLALALAMALDPSTGVRADCLLVRERELTYPIPHLALHFGDAADVPLHIQCSTSLDKNLPSLCVPIYAYNLGEGVSGFQFALNTPTPPTGFDRGPEITVLQMNVDTLSGTAITSFDLTTSAPICGPAFLGCIRLATAGLPESFQITMVEHHASILCAARTVAGEWRTATMDHGGAFIGPGSQCGDDLCHSNGPITNLRATQGARASIIDLSWRSGTGNYTLLRYRTDGHYPVDPWDGEPLGFLPSDITHYTYSTPLPGDVRIAAWSISRTAHGDYSSASNLECGSLTSITIQLPVAVVPSQWGSMKNLYR